MRAPHRPGPARCAHAKRERERSTQYAYSNQQAMRDGLVDECAHSVNSVPFCRRTYVRVSCVSRSRCSGALSVYMCLDLVWLVNVLHDTQQYEQHMRNHHRQIRPRRARAQTHASTHIIATVRRRLQRRRSWSIFFAALRCACACIARRHSL